MHKDLVQNGGTHQHYLEVDTIAFSLEHRLLASAQRLLDEQVGEFNGSGSSHSLRSHQTPVFDNFSNYLMDVATSPEDADLSQYCRIVLPPRTGKTILAGKIIARTGLSSTFVVPTKALVCQVSKELQRQIPGVPIGFFYSEKKYTVKNGINITTYASLQKNAIREQLPKEIRNSALIFLDEAHHAMTSLRMQAIKEAFNRKALRVALTATPDYNDQRRLHYFFPGLIHEIELSEAFDLGLLAPARMWVVEVDVNASEIRFVAGDYEQEMLGRLMSSSPFFKAVQIFRYKNSNLEIPALITCGSRQQAYDIWKYLKKHRPKGRPLPGLILGETPKRMREQLLCDFDCGRVDTLIQVGVLIEGWDAPHCKLLLDLAPSLSRVRATQKYFRVMTRYADEEAELFIILPKYLPRQPILPSDLLLKPGEDYLCGDLLRPQNKRDLFQDRPIDRHISTPIKDVKIKKRIVVYASLKKPVLDSNDLSQIGDVLRSNPGFDPRIPCGPLKFQRLFFQHPHFTGSGETLLRYLSVPNHKGAYWSFMAKLFPEQAGKGFLEGNGGIKGELWHSCFDDFQHFEQAMQAQNNNGGKPIEPFSATFRAFCGGVEYVPTPEDLMLAQEQISQLLIFFNQLFEREKRVLIQRFGLFGEPELTYDQIGEQIGVSKERVRQIVRKAIRKLSYKFWRARILENRIPLSVTQRN